MSEYCKAMNNGCIWVLSTLKDTAWARKGGGGGEGGHQRRKTKDEEMCVVQDSDSSLVNFRGAQNESIENNVT